MFDDIEKSAKSLNSALTKHKNKVVKDREAFLKKNPDGIFTPSEALPFRPSYVNKLPPIYKKAVIHVNDSLKKINAPEVSYQEKLDIIVEIQSYLVPLIFEQMFLDYPNKELSETAVKLTNVLKSISATIVKKRELENSEEINPMNPKFQLVFSWIMKLFDESMTEAKVEDLKKRLVFNALSLSLADWETEVQKKLKGLSSSELEELDNPFVAEFSTKLKTMTKLAQENGVSLES